MAGNKKSSDKIHDALNPYFKSKHNPNWKALIEAVGESDDKVFDLVQEVRKQFFISSSERPYIDRLAANLKISRPKIIGMDDPVFRKYIPILSYKPKQVKQIFSELLDVFYFREATSAFTVSTAFEPFPLKNDYEISLLVDGDKVEEIHFRVSDFTDITNATADEIAATINRNSTYSFATVFDDRVAKKKFVRIFSKTLGSTSSIEILGGRANIATKFVGFIDGAGSAINTIWNITKVGNTTTFTSTGGDPLNLGLVSQGDIAIIDIPGNEGSFTIDSVDLINNSFSFINLFSTTGAFDHTLNPGYFVRFAKRQKSVVFTRKNRALVWEINPGEVIIEMPATPPVVRRELKGSAHLNGLVGELADRLSDSSLILIDADEFPSSGKFTLELTEEIQTHILTPSTDTTTSHTINSRYDATKIYTYGAKTGNILSGISPPLPAESGIFEFAISTISRDGNDLVTVTTATPHGINVGEPVLIYDVLTGSGFNGTFNVVISSTNTFTYESTGSIEAAITGSVRYERIGMAAGTKVYLTSATSGSSILGAYVYDPNSSFVLSSFTSKINENIKAGNILINLSIQSNNLPDEEGFLIFEYGTESEEGPVRYLRKASTNSIILDPSYVFKKNHDINSNITAIRRRGGYVFSGLGREYPFYASDPAAARVVIQEVLNSVKSVGVFLNFIIRYPEVFYSDFDVYAQTLSVLD